jgi:hypothetical protein
MNRDHNKCKSNPNWIQQQADFIEKNKLKKIQRKLIYEENPKKCKLCNIPISYEKRINNFCSHTCCAKFNNPPVLKIFNCKFCGKLINSRKNGTIRIFCNHKCHSEYDYKEFIENWKQGKESGLVGYTVSKHIRRYLFEKYMNKCKECGWSKINQTTGNIPLQINHIDGNHLNNKEDNLELLCPSCHSLTPNFGALNKGQGREKRRKRYQEGKSY